MKPDLLLFSVFYEAKVYQLPHFVKCNEIQGNYTISPKLPLKALIWQQHTKMHVKLVAKVTL